ncbi:rhamnogalacturonan acetylesterase [Methylomonas methanica]|uniref:Lipolytic protein g-D-S-l family n=1 Tax=Methylomonas methanica (strain DSM 25384 / MC09) TaxID=857087 RepID=G0A754_METMM|nr:rhamnogalacturonan acetylesterase [Methylomonas methanica]AEG01848.1 lipolytic protein g-D-S-l family [Methylomonas methanica MC09]
MQRKLVLYFFLCLLPVYSQTAFGKRIVLIGDSTVSDYPMSRAPLTGWGQSLRKIIGERARVINLAVPGSSSLFFYNNYWESALSKIKAGDFILIQFGHVDASADPSKHTDPNNMFPSLLIRYINEAKLAGAHPILVTPVARYRFVHDKVVDTHGDYLKNIRRVADSMQVPLIDLAKMSAETINRLGAKDARTWFMLNYDGQDKDHLSIIGADAVALIVESALIDLAILKH